MSWKDKVNMLMSQRGITQKELSRLSGITESSISRYLHSNKRPRLDIVVNIAKALNVAPELITSQNEVSDYFEVGQKVYVYCPLNMC